MLIERGKLTLSSNRVSEKILLTQIDKQSWYMKMKKSHVSHTLKKTTNISIYSRSSNKNKSNSNYNIHDPAEATIGSAALPSPPPVQRQPGNRAQRRRRWGWGWRQRPSAAALTPPWPFRRTRIGNAPSQLAFLPNMRSYDWLIPWNLFITSIKRKVNIV